MLCCAVAQHNEIHNKTHPPDSLCETRDTDCSFHTGSLSRAEQPLLMTTQEGIMHCHKKEERIKMDNK